MKTIDNDYITIPNKCYKQVSLKDWHLLVITITGNMNKTALAKRQSKFISHFTGPCPKRLEVGDSFEEQVKDLKQTVDLQKTILIF